MTEKIIWVIFGIIMYIVILVLCGSTWGISTKLNNLEKRIIQIEERINEQN